MCNFLSQHKSFFCHFFLKWQKNKYFDLKKYKTHGDLVVSTSASQFWSSGREPRLTPPCVGFACFPCLHEFSSGTTAFYNILETCIRGPLMKRDYPYSGWLFFAGGGGIHICPATNPDPASLPKSDEIGSSST